MSKNNNWIKLNRKILKNKHWLKKPYSKGQAIVDMLLIADFKNGKFSGSLSFFATRWGWSTSKVSKFFKALIDDEFIQKIGNSNGSRNGNSNGNTFGNTYLIENYSTYQAKETEVETVVETLLETAMEDNKRSNIKEVNKKKLKKEYDQLFFDLWMEYLEYRKAQKIKKYAKLQYEKKAYNEFIELSNFDPDEGRKVLDQTIINSYRGLFPLNSKSKGGALEIDKSDDATNSGAWLRG